MKRTTIPFLATLMLVASCQASDAAVSPTTASTVAQADDTTEPADATEVAATTLGTTTTEPPVTPHADRDGGVDGPVVFWRFTESNEGEQAAIEGPLVIENDCVYVGLDDDRSPVLWRYGTAWDAANEALVFPSATSAESGDVVRSGGGFHPLDGLSRFTSSAVVLDALARCAPLGEVFVVQSDVEIRSVAR